MPPGLLLRLRGVWERELLSPRLLGLSDLHPFFHGVVSSAIVFPSAGEKQKLTCDNNCGRYTNYFLSFGESEGWDLGLGHESE